MGFTDFISIVALYVEIGVLAYCDWKMWRTLYTPLNLLMLPYAFILFITLMSCGNMGIVEFYYPSIMVWMVGILIFSIPSYLFYLHLHGDIVNIKIGEIDDNVNMKILNIMTVFLILAFFYRFYSMLGSSPYLPGSEDFGYDYCGKGVWGHLHRVLHALSIIYIYKYDNKHRYYLLFVLGMFFVTHTYTCYNRDKNPRFDIIYKRNKKHS